MNDETCQCPACGRLHHKLPYGPPPHSELERLRAENEKLMAIIKSHEPFEENRRLVAEIRWLREERE